MVLKILIFCLPLFNTVAKKSYSQVEKNIGEAFASPLPPLQTPRYACETRSTHVTLQGYATPTWKRSGKNFKKEITLSA
jgi:transcription elongation factor